MSWLSRVFGGGGSTGAQSTEPVDYKGFSITPDPISESGQFRLAGWIRMDVDGETREHHLIRADQFRARDEAEAATVNKAKQMIDQMGQGLFD